MNEMMWDGWLERLYNLRRDKRGSHERPHKPLLLLSIIDLVDRGAIHANKIPLSDQLVETFRGLFETVRTEVWSLHIGGYQVWEKWLKDRKGRTLSAEDRSHYQKIIVALSETIRLMAEIDAVIAQHGRWPLK